MYLLLFPFSYIHVLLTIGLLQFYKPARISIDWFQKDNYGKLVDDNGTPLEPIGFLHIIEHRFLLSEFKSALLTRLLHNLEPQSSILLVDVLSVWKQYISRFNDVGKCIHYMNTASVVHFDTLINFLLQLNESPSDALARCKGNVQSTSYQLSGIVIDNISYFTHDGASYNLLYKLLKMLRKNYGCFIVTIGYGLEYYEGIELSLGGSTQYLDIPTRLPMSYVKNMDCVLLRDSEESARVL